MTDPKTWLEERAEAEAKEHEDIPCSECGDSYSLAAVKATYKRGAKELARELLRRVVFRDGASGDENSAFLREHIRELCGPVEE